MEIKSVLHEEANKGAFNAGLAMAYKFWTFGQIGRGDCMIFAGAVFTLYQDGTTNWRCDIRSSDSGDEWDGDIICYNAANVELWRDHYHFNISDENATKRWDETRGANAARANSFAEASTLNFSCNC